MTFRDKSRPRYENQRTAAEHILEPYTTGKSDESGSARNVVLRNRLDKHEAYGNVLSTLDHIEMRYKKLIVRNVPDSILARYLEEREVLRNAERDLLKWGAN